MSARPASPVTTPTAAIAAPRVSPRRLLRFFVLFALIPYLAVTTLFVCCQRELIYQPTKTSRLLAADVATPDLALEDVEVEATDGRVLHGWRFLAKQEADDGSPFLVIYFPGNAGCRRDRYADCRDFTNLGCEVLLFDYRGYGDNGGSPSEEHLAADAQRVWSLATKQLGFSPARIVLFGESLGGAVATRLAAERAQTGEPPAALVLNSTFASLGETVAWHYPAFPFRYFLWDHFPSVDRIPHVGCPVLQFHGTGDDIVPLAHGQRLFAAAPTRSPTGIASRFVTVQDGQHNFIAMPDMHTAVGMLLAEIRKRTIPEP
uniref:Alpha/beta hydrolase n=1 Tax=Schlesneria paludicola TaxID=360056 RepID=A0A7C2P0U4_9PLAN